MFMASSSSTTTSPTSTPYHRSRFGDTTWTKVFVGGLAWETPTEELSRYFEQFGDILEAVIITDKNTGRSKGYGFVTFREPEAAMRSVAEPNPVIDGRRANCNIAAFGRPRPSPPRGRNQAGSIYQGPAQPMGPPQYSRVAAQMPSPPPLIYPAQFGYLTYPTEYGYQQAVYNHPQMTPHYYQQMYGPSSPSNMVEPSPRALGTPYLYPHFGYPMQAGPSPRALGPRPTTSLQHPTPPAAHLPEGSSIPDSSSQPLTFHLKQPPHVRQQPLNTTTSDLPTSQEPSTSGENVKPEISEA